MAFRSLYFFFFFNDTATTEIYTLSLHDALPISVGDRDSVAHRRGPRRRDRRAGIARGVQHGTGAPRLAGGVRRDGGRELRRGGGPCRARPRRDARRRWALAQREPALRPPRRHPLQYSHRLGAGRGGSPARW